MSAEWPPVPFSVPLDEGWVCSRPATHFERVSGTAPERHEVRLPHDAMREAQRSPEAPSGGSSGYFPGGVWRYTRTLEVPRDWQARWVSLTFDGVYADARVYVDDVLVAHRPNGYARFSVDLAPHLQFGARNRLRVDVRTHLDSRWYSGAGLYREVRLRVAGGVHIAPDGVRVHTPDVDDDYAAVEVVTDLVNETSLMRTVRLATRLDDPDAGEAVSDDVPVTLPPGATVRARRRLWVRSPRRWSPEAPQLYRARVTVREEDAVLDERAEAFGIRTLRLDPFRGLRINDVPVTLRGACVHHDNGLLGAISHPDAEDRKVRRLREAGFNAVRMAHNPASQALLEACDRHGMLVMNEAFDVWHNEKTAFDYSRSFDRWWRDDLEAMVAGSVNHPSVVMYSIGNEIPELGRADGRVTGRRLAEHVRSLDPTRPITNAMQILFLVDLDAQIEAAGGLNQFLGGVLDRRADEGQGFAAGQNVVATSPLADAAIEEACSVVDVTGYNYAEGRYAFDAEHHPQRVSVGSETFPTRIANNWRLVSQHPNVIGDFTWAGWDYLGEAGIGGHAYEEDGATFPYGLGYPNLTAACGDLDITGVRLPVSFYREIVFGLRHEPYIAVGRPARFAHTIPAPNAWQWSDTVSSWTWPGFEGRPIRVEVYAAAEEVELILNGSVVGRATVGERRPLVATMTLNYQPGTLVAVALVDGREISRTVLVSAEEVAGLRLTCEQAAIAAPGGLAFVDVDVVDAAGRLNTAGAHRLGVQVQGPGRLVALGTGRPRTEERFDAAVCTSYDGRAQAVIRSDGPGPIRVTVIDIDTELSSGVVIEATPYSV